MRNFLGKQGQFGRILTLFLLAALLVITTFLAFIPKGSFSAITPIAESEVSSTVVDPVQSEAPAENSAVEFQATSTPANTAETEGTAFAAGDIRTSDIDGMEQVFVPSGDFLMGTNDIEAKRDIAGGRAYPEVPQYTYTLDSFWIDKYEVTNKQYHDCMKAGACTEPHRIGSYTYADYFTNPIYDNYPVVWVNWFQANDYCSWAGRRLPTEAEWEKAARGTDGRKYTWGNEPYSGDKANICDVNCTRTHRLENIDDGYPDLAPVGSYPAGASPYGALDMAGNVWEWNSSVIMDYPYDPNDGREADYNYAVERVWRGSAWSNGLWWLRASTRYHSLDYYSWYVLGIRCAATQ